MTQNSNEKVDIFFFNHSLSDAYLNVVFLFNLLFGVAAGFLASVFVIISNKSEIKSLQNKNKALSEELNNLRNVAIDEAIYETVEEGSINIGLSLYYYNCSCIYNHNFILLLL